MTRTAPAGWIRAAPHPVRATSPHTSRIAWLAGRAVGLPLILIGYWQLGPAGDVADQEEWPAANGFVDEQWDEAERDRVASYLDQGLISWVQAGLSPCRFCGAANGSAERTDGAYLWPEGFAHYLRDHGVRPPVSVIRHIISRQHAAPAERGPAMVEDPAGRSGLPRPRHACRVVGRPDRR